MERLELAKKYLDVADTEDSKREAYKQAAEEVIAHKEETGESDSDIAISLQRSRPYVQKLRSWYQGGMVNRTPFSTENMPKPLTRAQRDQLDRTNATDPEIRALRKIEAVFDTMTVLDMLQEASKGLQEILDTGEATPELLRTLEDEHQKFGSLLDFAKQLVGE
jgi:hypothetical protein